MFVNLSNIRWEHARLFLIGMIIFPSILLSGEVITIRNESTGLFDRDDIHEFELEKDLTIGVGNEDDDPVFGRISGITVDSRSNIYILDSSISTVFVYDSTGAYAFSFGRKGNGPGEFSAPSAIAIDNLDNILVADRNRLSIYNQEGLYDTTYQMKTTGPIRSIAIDSDDNIYVSCFEVFEQNIIHKYNCNGEYVSSFCSSFGRDTDIDLRIEAAFAGGYICVDGHDVIYFTQLLPYEIRTYSSDGILRSRIYRENSFIKDPEEYVKLDDERIEFTMPSMSSSILVLPDEYIINTVRCPSDSGAEASTIMDFFDATGRLLSTKFLEGSIRFACRDRHNRIYAIDNTTYPRVDRYALMLK